MDLFTQITQVVDFREIIDFDECTPKLFSCDQGSLLVIYIAYSLVFIQYCQQRGFN